MFRNVQELEEAINKDLAVHNDNPRLLFLNIWTKSADTILSKVEKCKEAVQTTRYLLSNFCQMEAMTEEDEYTPASG